MEHCTLYSHYLKFDKIVDILKDHLPHAKIEKEENGIHKKIVATIKGGIFSKTKTLSLNYRERTTPSYNLEHATCPLSKNLKGMTQFVHSIPFENQALKSKFLHKIMASNAEIAFIGDPKINEQFRLILKRITVELDAFIFTNSNSIFHLSEHQHFVDKHFKLIIDAHGNSKVDAIDVQIESKYHASHKDEISEEQQLRKEKSERYLTSKGVKVNVHLPCVESSTQIKLRTKSELIHRIYALLVIAARGEGVEQKRLQQLMEEKNIISLSPKEKSVFYQDELSPEDQAYATWRYESLNTLLWAVHEAPLPYPSAICNVQEIVGKLVQKDKATFTKSWTIRSAHEVLDALDEIYRMNWACVDARLKGTSPEGELNPGVVYERHYALNWLTNYQDLEWDDVTTDT